MAAVKGKKFTSNNRRVSPIKPNLRGMRNMMAAKHRAAYYSKAAAVRFWAGIVFVVCGTIFMALWMGGVLPDVRKAGQDFKQERLMAMGFVVERVDVMGEGRLREDDVRRALQITPGDYLFGADLDAAKERVESLSWVENALVRRLWPNRIVVQIIERRPYALWQKDGLVQLVDAGGVVISNANALDFTQLPLFVGAGAADEAPAMRAMLADFPEIAARIDALVYVSEQRWNLVMNDGAMTVKLPLDNPRAALAKLQALNASAQILDREIASIDLRIDNRISLSPSDVDRA